MDAYAVLLPAIDDLILTDQLGRFLDEGGRSFLIGETREEYVARQMSSTRHETETADHIQALTAEITRRAGPALIALDQEPSGICRLHGLVPALPKSNDLRIMPCDEIERLSYAVGLAARHMGIKMFLAPVIDTVTGQNSWLDGRCLGSDAATIARIGAAVVRGTEAAGIIACAKHFPGHHDMDGDPALEIATVSGGMAQLEPGMLPFRKVIQAGARAIMTGPALVPGMDPVMPSSLSAITIGALRSLGFKGLVVSDDLDAPGILRGTRDVASAAVEALQAGSDLLLLSGKNDLPMIRDRIIAATHQGTVPRKRLSEAAASVRALASAELPG